MHCTQVFRTVASLFTYKHPTETQWLQTPNLVTTCLCLNYHHQCTSHGVDTKRITYPPPAQPCPFLHLPRVFLGILEGTIARCARHPNQCSGHLCFTMLYTRHTKLGVPFSRLQKHKSFMHDWNKWWPGSVMTTLTSLRIIACSLGH